MLCHQPLCLSRKHCAACSELLLLSVILCMQPHHVHWIVLLQVSKIQSFELSLARCAITGCTTLYTILYDTTLLQFSLDNDPICNNITYCRKVGLRVLELRSCRSHCNRSCRTPSTKLLWLLLSGKKLNRLWQTCKPNLRRLLVSRPLLRWTAVPQSLCQSPLVPISTAWGLQYMCLQLTEHGTDH